MNIEDLQKAIDILYNPQANDPTVRQQAQDYCNTFARANAASLADFFTYFAQTNNQTTRFWLLQAIADIICNYYGQIFTVAEQRGQIHSVYFKVLTENAGLILNQKHFANKYALVFVLLLREDFPQLWPSAINDLLALVKNTQDFATQKMFMRFLIRVFLVFEEEMVDRQESKPPAVLEKQARVKDGLREVIRDVVFVLMQALQNHQWFDEETVDDALEVMSQLIDWNSLDLFGDCIETFKMFLKSEKYRTNALHCLHAFVYKGMDYPQKVELIVNMGFMDILESFQPRFRDRPPEDSEVSLEEQDEEEEFFQFVSEVVDKLGQWCLELYQNQGKLLPTADHQQQYEYIYTRTLRVSLDVLDTDKPKVGRNIIEFLQFWLQAIRKYHDLPASQQPLPEFYTQTLTSLLQIIIKRIKYPDWCTFQEGSTLSEHEEDYIAYREELAAIFVSIAMVKNFHENLLRTIAALFESVIPGKTPHNQAEVPLFLAYHLHQAIPHQMKEKVDNEYYQLMLYIMKIDFLSYDHKIVSLMLLENLVRYSSYFIQDAVYQSQIAGIFFSRKAILSSEPQLASRSCYLFLRLCEKQQNLLVNYVQSIMENTIATIKKVENGSSDHLITYDDLQYLYNVVGIFVSNKRIDYEYRRKVVAQLMDSLVSRLAQCQAMERDKICWILKFLNVFTKGFQQEISAVMKESFAKVLQQVLTLLPQNMNNTHISDQILQYLQKNVVILGTDVKQFILQIAQPYIQGIEFERLELFLTIINYTLTVLREQGIDLIEQLLLDIFYKMNAVKVPESDTSDIEKNNIRIFQGFFKILQTAVDINSNFLVSQRNSPYLETLIKYLIQHFQTNVDRASKKTVSGILRDLFFSFSGLSANPANNSLIGKKAPTQQSPIHMANGGQTNKSIVNSMPQLYQFFVEQVLWVSLQYTFQLNPQSLEEAQIMKNLVDVQAMFVAAGYREQLVAALQQVVDQQAAVAIEQQCESLVMKQISYRQYQDNYVKFIAQLRQK